MFKWIVNFFNGRSTMFAVYFALIGTVLAWYNKLDPNYVALIAALQGFVVVHSIKDDYHQRNNPNCGGGDDIPPVR